MAVVGNEQFRRSAALFQRARAAGRRLLPARGGVGSSWAVSLVEIVLAIAVGLVFARLVWTFAAPLPVSAAPPPPKTAAPAPAEVSNLFRAIVAPEVDPVAVAAEAAETSLNLALHGTWVEPDGRGTAIIRTPDGVQKSFSVGDTICCGARLNGVFADRVEITRGGARESLSLANKLSSEKRKSRARPARAKQAAASRAKQTAAPRPKPADEPQAAGKLQNLIRLTPTRDASGLLKFQLFPAADESAFERAGFRSGDILVAINGKPSPGSIEGARQLMIELEGATTLNATIERNGVRVPIVVKDVPSLAARKAVE